MRSAPIFAECVLQFSGDRDASQIFAASRQPIFRTKEFQFLEARETSFFRHFAHCFSFSDVRGKFACFWTFDELSARRFSNPILSRMRLRPFRDLRESQRATGDQAPSWLAEARRPMLVKGSWVGGCGAGPSSRKGERA